VPKKNSIVLQRKIPFGINSLIFQEVLQGAGSEKEYLILKKYLESQRFYHLKDPVDSFAKAAKIYLDCRKKGITIRSTIDCLIAQTALENGLVLLHEDSDFDLMSKVIPLKFYN
jgi:predicted nucleic acid-binding protein